MANPIETTYSTGSTLYAVVHHTDGRIWNNVALAFQAYNGASWAQYAIPLTEQGSSGYYRADFPAGAVGDFLTTEVVYNQAGVAPDVVDAPATGIGQSQGVDVAAIAKSTVAAARLALSLGGMATGAVTSASAPSATSFSTNLPSLKNNTYQGRLMLWVTGDLKDEVGNVTASAAINGQVTVSGPFTAAPGVADSFIIV